MKTWNGLEPLEARTLFSAGTIDTSFGNKGTVTAQANIVLKDIGAYAEVNRIAQQSDGKLLLAGNDDDNTFVIRTDAKGNLDTSFGDDGVAIVSFKNGHNPSLSAIAIDKNNRIVIGGTVEPTPTENDDAQFVVARLTASGNLDPNFGKNGEASASFGQAATTANALAIDPQGRIIIAGTFDGNDASQMAVARFTPNGHLDTQFSLDGRQTIDVAGGDNSANALAVRPDGSLLLAGDSGFEPGIGDMTVVSLTPAGQLDHSLNGTGIATVGFTENSQATAILLQTDGKIVLAGNDTQPETTLPIMARLLPNGSLDTTFSHDGKLSPKEWPVGLQSPTQIVRGSDGYYRIYDGNLESRVSFGGKPNMAFGSSDVQSFSFATDDGPNALLVKPDDSAIAVSTSDSVPGFGPSGMDIEFDTSDGQSNSSAQRFFDLGNAAMNVDSNGGLLAAMPASGLFAVYRFTRSGTLDSTFGDDGRSVIPSPDSEGSSVRTINIIPTGDGRFILDGSGTAHFGDDGVAIIMARGNTDGTVDRNYPDETSGNFAGFDTETEDGNVQLLPHGYVFASQNEENETYEIGGFLIAPNGQVTPAGDYDDNQIGSGTQVDNIIPFRDTGATLVQYEILTVKEDDIGDFSITASTPYLRKVGPGASSFGNNGTLKGSYDLLDAQPGGKILYLSDGGVHRLNANGTPDSTFGTKGLAAAGYTSFTVDAHNRIIAWKVRKDGNIQIARFTLNGQPDKSFNGNGQVIVNSPIQNGTNNLLVTPNDDLVLTTLNQSGSTVKWSAIRIKGS